MTFGVSVSRDYLAFSAAHFLTVPGHKCESLHGHNYVVTAAVEGDVDPATGFVIDFAALKRVLAPAVAGLDHRVLIPGRNPRVEARIEGEHLVVAVDGRDRFTFPSAHAVTLAVVHTTAELLAEWLAREAAAGLKRDGVKGIRVLRVEVEESPGQHGTFALETGS